MSCLHKKLQNQRWCSNNNLTITFICPDCKKQFTRDTTAKEKKVLSKELFGRCKEMHKLNHEFQRKFVTKNGFKWKGWGLIEKVEKWAEKNPEVRICSCDDNVFTSSILVFIPGQDKYRYFGTSVVYIPQCTGEEPIEFFLYPRHTKNLLDVLKKIRKDETRKREKEVRESHKFRFGKISNGK